MISFAHRIFSARGAESAFGARKEQYFLIVDIIFWASR